MKYIKTLAILCMLTLIIASASTVRGNEDQGEALDFSIKSVQEYPGIKIFTISAENRSQTAYRFGTPRYTNHLVIRTDEGEFESPLHSSVGDADTLKNGTTTYRVALDAPGEIESAHFTHVKRDSLTVFDTFTAPVDTSEYQVYNMAYVLGGVLAVFGLALVVTKNTMNTFRFLMVATLRVFALFVIANLVFRRSDLFFMVNGIETMTLSIMMFSSLLLSAGINHVYDQMEASGVIGHRSGRGKHSRSKSSWKNSRDSYDSNDAMRRHQEQDRLFREQVQRDQNRVFQEEHDRFAQESLNNTMNDLNNHNNF